MQALRAKNAMQRLADLRLSLDGLVPVNEASQRLVPHVQSVDVPEVAIFFARQILTVVPELSETSTFTKFVAKYGEFQY